MRGSGALVVCVGRTDVRQSGVEQLNNDLKHALEASGARFEWLDWSAYTPSDERGWFSFNALGGAASTIAGLARACFRHRRAGTVVYAPLSQQGWGLGRDIAALALAALSGGARRSTVVHLHGEFRAEMQTRPRVAKLAYRIVARMPRTSFVANVRGLRFCGRATTFVPNRPSLPAAVAEARSRPKSAEPTVVYLGVISPAKGCQVLMSAFRQVTVPARLVLVGPEYRRLPGYEARFCGQAEWSRALEIIDGDERVVRVGPVYGDERYEWLRRAWVCVVPSFTEGGCLVVQEALASGTQVIATRVGPLAEMVEGTPGHVLVPAGDAGALAMAIEEALSLPPSEPAGVSPAYASGGTSALEVLLQTAGQTPRQTADQMPASGAARPAAGRR
ncbi:MAG: glycosyltransferase family 4 protein [Acidimicrobiales bacterium]